MTKFLTEKKFNEKEVVWLIDIDNTINDLSEHFINRVISMGYEFDVSKTNSFNLEDGIIADNPKQVLHTIFTDDNFWLSIPIRHNAVNALTYLNNRFDVFIVTTPYNEHNKLIKKKYVNDHFSFMNKKLIFSSVEKWKIAGDIIVDDRPEILVGSKNNSNLIVVNAVQSYNLDIDSDFDLYNWSDIDLLADDIMDFYKEI